MEATMLLGMLKTHGPMTAIVTTVVTGLLALLKMKVQADKEHRAVKDAERSELFRALTNQNSQTLVILRDELRTAQESNHRHFEMMSRNTSALEKLVEQSAQQSISMRDIRIDMEDIKGDIRQINGAISRCDK